MTSKYFVSSACALLALVIAGASRADGDVYILSNDVGLNEVLVYQRGDRGDLRAAGTFATGGRGSGAGLGSQGAVVLSRDGALLFAVDAGNDEVTSFRVEGDRLAIVSHLDSGGQHPISLTVHDDLLYVLNDGGNGNIAGFRVDEDGSLEPLPNSSRPLSGTAVGPAQVAFAPDGEHLVVTEKNTNRLSIYDVAESGYADGPTVSVSSGQTPFGFDFTSRGLLVVSEAFGGAAGAGAASSYAIRGDRTFALSASVPERQGSPCWLVITRDGRTAFLANTGSGTVSAYAIGHDGRLTLRQADGVAGSTGAGSGPADLALSRGSRYLYVRDGGTRAISAFRVGAGGSLEAIPGVSGLPAQSVGIAVR